VARRSHLLLWALLFSSLASANEDDAQLWEGASHFRSGRFAQALVAFQVAERRGRPEAAWYVAASLQKLARHPEALEAFFRAEIAAPGARDSLLDYYRALTCFELRLFRCADGLLKTVEQSGGPSVRNEAARVRASIASVLRATPEKATIDWYYDEGLRHLTSGRAGSATRYFEEAQALAERRRDAYRRDELVAQLAKARQHIEEQETR
jgi:tetratricopeptide (TPR) repeat protein